MHAGAESGEALEHNGQCPGALDAVHHKVHPALGAARGQTLEVQAQAVLEADPGDGKDPRAGADGFQ